MPSVAELGFAPGKSLVAYKDVTQIELGVEGVVGDRSYMLVEAEPHVNVNFKRGFVAKPGYQLTLREDPALTNIIPIIDTKTGMLEIRTRQGDGLVVPRVEDIAENRIPVQVWGWNGEAVDQGDDAAELARSIVGRPVRLVRISDEKPRYVEGNASLGRVGFADGFPVTVGSTDSLELINNQLVAQGNSEIPARRARVTMLLSGLRLPEGVTVPENSFPDDYIQTITIAQDGLVAVLRRFKACGRCPIPDTNDVTGERKGRPVLKALTKLGRHGTHLDVESYGSDAEDFWTQNFIIELPPDMPEGATISVERGAEVEVAYSEDTNWVRTKDK